MTIVNFNFLSIQVTHSLYKKYKLLISMDNFLHNKCLEETETGGEAAAYIH